MKYELLLRDILKFSERAGLVQEIPPLVDAIYVMKVSIHFFFHFFCHKYLEFCWPPQNELFFKHSRKELIKIIETY